MIRMPISTGMPPASLSGLRVADLDRDMQVAIVVGKGARLRACPYEAKAGQAVDRYLRIRRQYPHAESEWLWLGKKGRVTDSRLPVGRAPGPTSRNRPCSSPPAPPHLCTLLPGRRRE